jgi:hypothetical protein
MRGRDTRREFDDDASARDLEVKDTGNQSSS